MRRVRHIHANDHIRTRRNHHPLTRYWVRVPANDALTRPVRGSMSNMHDRGQSDSSFRTNARQADAGAPWLTSGHCAAFASTHVVLARSVRSSLRPMTLPRSRRTAPSSAFARSKASTSGAAATTMPWPRGATRRGWNRALCAATRAPMIYIHRHRFDRRRHGGHANRVAGPRAPGRLVRADRLASRADDARAQRGAPRIDCVRYRRI